MTPLKINTLDSKIEDFLDARNYALEVIESYINGQISSIRRIMMQTILTTTMNHVRLRLIKFLHH